MDIAKRVSEYGRIILVAGILAEVSSPKVSPDLKLYLKAVEEGRKAEIGKLESEMSNLAKQVRISRARRQRSSALSASKRIATIKRKLAGFKRNQLPYRPMVDPLEVVTGQIGFLDIPSVWDWGFRVITVVDDQTMLVACHYTTQTIAQQGTGRHVSIRPGIKKISRVFQIVGVQTAGYVTDGVFKPDCPFIAMGTSEYTTVLGAKRTVMVLRALRLPRGALPSQGHMTTKTPHKGKRGPSPSNETEHLAPIP